MSLKQCLLACVEDPIPFPIAGKDAGRFDQLFVGYGDKRMIYHLADKKAPDGYDPTARPWYRLASEVSQRSASAVSALAG